MRMVVMEASVAQAKANMFRRGSPPAAAFAGEESSGTAAAFSSAMVDTVAGFLEECWKPNYNVICRRGTSTCLLRRTPITVPFPRLSDELIDAIHDTPEKRERGRELHARAAEFVKKDRDEVDDILEQYRAYGLAVQEVEVRDDDDEDY
ncbi:hypothetical protein HU200_049001 [Digitaria exilis]|uniref:Uncharacterized protein n=1 Tax=Digitaria exilis TaxID=1010633 RepID=A0A835ASD1_9POAL|nr:hypothetical protein HU200_049001 [Digitaria exilis]